ncbi:MAG: AMP-binding protein [Dehalococcoidia bacterium]
MVINLFKPKIINEDPIAEFLRTSETPLTIPAMLRDGQARFGRKVGFQQKVEGDWQTLTFDELWRQANDFAAGMIAFGLQKGDRTAIICENCLDWVVAYFGLSLAGGIAVPLYTELKRGEIEELVQRSGARFIIVSNRVAERLDGQLPPAEKVIVIGGTETRPGRPPRFLRRGRPGHLPFDQVGDNATEESRAELERRHVEPDDIASIVFTSGTTGGMKGVMLSHKNFTSNVESIRRTLQVDEKDRMVLVLPLHHAFPFIVFLANAAVGGELTFENDLLRVRDRLQETRPTIFLGVPALFEQMYRAVVRRAEAEGRLEMFERGLRVVDVAKRRTGVNLGRLVFREVYQLLGGSLRFVVTGGAAIKPEVMHQFYRLGLPVLQGWGLSEAAPVVALQRWQPSKFFFSNHYEELAGSVGEPLDGVEVKLIDVPEKDIFVHLHGEGELIVRGPNVFAGYWQAPEETGAAKVGEWLRTGDLGRIDDEGNIWITGRSKYVIVLDSGEKVVPDELEERFRGSELLQDVCVVPRQNRDKTQVGAIVSPNLEAARALVNGAELTEQTVRALVQKELDAQAKELAPHKRVSELILTDTPLPKTALQDVARGRIEDSYSFDVKRWQELALAPEPEATSEDETPNEA